MKHKPIAIVLAGTVPHVRLIENLKARGYYTVLVDYYENPPAKKAADEHIRESTLDQEKVLEIAKRLKAELVITTCMDHANVTACYVAEKLGLPAPYSYETSLSVTNKGLMKEKMIRNGLPTSKYVLVKNLEDFKTSDLKFPVAVKPADSNGSKGVRRACNHEELSRFLEGALKFSRCGKAIVEEYKEGREIGVDCFIQNKKATILMTKERRKISTSGDLTQQIYGCIWPANLSDQDQSELRKIAFRIATVFKLYNTPLMIQAILNADGIHIIEFAARFGGGESFRLIKLSTGFDIIDAAIDSFLGIKVNFDHTPPANFYADNFIYAQAGLFGRIAGYEALLKNRVIEYIDAYKTAGAEIGDELTGNNRVGVFAVKAKEKMELFEKITQSLKCLQVYDIHGKPIMRKDIYSA